MMIIISAIIGLYLYYIKSSYGFFLSKNNQVIIILVFHFISCLLIELFAIRLTGINTNIMLIDNRNSYYVILMILFMCFGGFFVVSRLNIDIFKEQIELPIILYFFVGAIFEALRRLRRIK